MAYPVFLYIAYAGNVSVYITCGLIYYHFYESGPQKAMKTSIS